MIKHSIVCQNRLLIIITQVQNIFAGQIKQVNDRNDPVVKHVGLVLKVGKLFKKSLNINFGNPSLYILLMHGTADISSYLQTVHIASTKQSN